MSPVRPPVITGLAPGSGASTLAAALHAVDAGVLGAHVACEADVVVCRAGALRHAVALACAPSGQRPLLAVVLESAVSGPDARRLASARTRFAAVTVLPCVPHWRGKSDAREEAIAVLGMRAEHLSEPVSAYAAALRALVTALATCGLLARNTPPLVSRPSGRPPADMAPPTPVAPPPSVVVPPSPYPQPERARAAVSARSAAPGHAVIVDRVPSQTAVAAPADLDDEALEAMLLLPPVPAAGRAG